MWDLFVSERGAKMAERRRRRGEEAPSRIPGLVQVLVVIWLGSLACDAANVGISKYTQNVFNFIWEI